MSDVVIVGSVSRMAGVAGVTHLHGHMNRGWSTAQHSTAQHSTAQHSTAQHSTAQHSTAQSISKTSTKDMQSALSLLDYAVRVIDSFVMDWGDVALC